MKTASPRVTGLSGTEVIPFELRDAELRNCSLTLANLLDEVDGVVGGHRAPTPQFLHSFNTFVESCVLTDALYVPLLDAEHLSLAAPAFPGGRPVTGMLIRDKLLRAIGEGPDALRGGTGKVIHAFSVAEGKTPETDRRWFREYTRDIRERGCLDLFPSYGIGAAPRTTPLLVVCGGRAAGNYAVAMADRDVSRCIQLVLSFSSGSRLHPALPLYAAKAQAGFFPGEVPSVDLYARIADIHRVKVEELLKFTGYRQVPIPPLASILLSRCRGREDIPDQIRMLRAEFQGLRDAGRSHQEQLEAASSLDEQFRVMEEFNEFWEAFARKTKHKTTRLIYRIWDVIKEGDPWKIVTKSVDRLAAWDQDRAILNRYKGLMDIWRLTRNIPPVQRQLLDVERVFGSAIAENDWRRYASFADEMNMATFPEGRGTE